jgi:hypothetical protein
MMAKPSFEVNLITGFRKCFLRQEKQEPAYSTMILFVQYLCQEHVCQGQNVGVWVCLQRSSNIELPPTNSNRLICKRCAEIRSVEVVI